MVGEATHEAISGRVFAFRAPLKVFAQRFTFLGLIALSVGLWSWARPETPAGRARPHDHYRRLHPGASMPCPGRWRRCRDQRPHFQHDERLRENIAAGAKKRSVASTGRPSPASSRPKPRPARKSRISCLSPRSVSCRRALSPMPAGRSSARCWSWPVRATGVAKGAGGGHGEGLVAALARLATAGPASCADRLQQQVPVMIEGSGERAILTGQFRPAETGLSHSTARRRRATVS